jgi:hypothetical protein
LFWAFDSVLRIFRRYSKSSLTLTLTLNEWRFNLSFSWVSMLFLNSCRVSSHIVRYDTNPTAIQKQNWHWRKAQIEPPLIDCECEWAFRIRTFIRRIDYSNFRAAIDARSVGTSVCFRGLWERLIGWWITVCWLPLIAIEFGW